MPIGEFDPDHDPNKWGALLASQFSDGAGFTVPTADGLDRSDGRRVLKEHLSRGGRAAVWYSADDPYSVLGFAVVAAEPQTVVWAWTRPALRSKRGQPRVGVMSALLEYLSIDLFEEVVALYPSLASDGMKRRGKSIRYSHEKESNG